MLKIRFFLLLAVFKVICSGSVTGQVIKHADSLKIEHNIHTLFSAQYGYLVNTLNSSSVSKLYDIQVWTQALLDGAFVSKNYDIIDSLAGLYLIPLKDLVKTDVYCVDYPDRIDTVKTVKPVNLWLYPAVKTIDTVKYTFDREIHLTSAQYLYLMVRTMKHAANIPHPADYANLDTFITLYRDIILSDYYNRWLFGKGDFQVRSWGCIKGTYNHPELLKLKNETRFKGKPSYCNSVTDLDLWIMAGVAEVLLIDREHPDIFRLTQGYRDSLSSYLRYAMDFVNSKCRYETVKQKNGVSYEIMNFDMKAWVDHKEYSYGKCECDSFPTNEKLKKLKSIGWDISHARRFVQVFESLKEVAPLVKSDVDVERILHGLANQFMYGIFNNDLEKPLFVNYMDGSNGWYRVNYHGEGFGYGPYDLSVAAVTGSFFRWGYYNPEIFKVRDAVWKMFSSTDPSVIAHYKNYYGRYYEHGKRTPETDVFNYKSSGSLIMLQFLPMFYYGD